MKKALLLVAATLLAINAQGTETSTEESADTSSSGTRARAACNSEYATEGEDCVMDSTGIRNVGSAELRWEVGSWSSCSAPNPSCGQTTSGSQSRSVTCIGDYLNGTTLTVSTSLCQNSDPNFLPKLAHNLHRQWRAINQALPARHHR